MLQSKTITNALPNVLKTVNLERFGEKYQGKVRDFYKVDGKRILITTDRQSAFDMVLGYIPYKGAVLNLLSMFWFMKTKHIVPNHLMSVPHPNVMICRECKGIPIEMVVRGYLTGVTKTSPWFNYERGERIIYGVRFPDGLEKNQKLDTPIITPTTHGVVGVHDERLTRDEIVNRMIVSEKLYEEMERVSLQLFEFGSKLCNQRGLILVDTKYEFGLYKGKLTLIDELHTPDSSRFWKMDTYQKRFSSGAEPENFDKEFLRLWYADKGYRGDGPPPSMPKDLIVSLATRYMRVYEKITSQTFRAYTYPIDETIRHELHNVRH